MKKRLLSILLVCCMVLTLLPVTAYADTLYTVHPVEISSREYATVDDLETNSGAVITLGKNSRGRNGNQKWYVFGKDNGVNGRNTVLFARNQFNRFFRIRTKRGIPASPGIN